LTVRRHRGLDADGLARGAAVTATIPDTALDPVAARLHRIEGQTCALGRMYEAGRSTTDLLDLIAADRAALGGLGLVLITQKVTDRAGTGPRALAAGGEHVEAVLTLVQRLVRCT
jgi:DNA-binding FrmR family transcriptional regulator